MVEGEILKKLGLLVGRAIAGRILVTKWVRPSSGRLKLNANECSKGNPGPSGGGRILRDHCGHLFWRRQTGSESSPILYRYRTLVDRY